MLTWLPPARYFLSFPLPGFAQNPRGEAIERTLPTVLRAIGAVFSDDSHLPFVLSLVEA